MVVNHSYLCLTLHGCSYFGFNDIQTAVMFWSVRPEDALLQCGPISDWDTSKVRDMSVLFSSKEKFCHSCRSSHN